MLFPPFSRLLARLAVALGLVALWHYRQLGLTLSHYDAKAHLVVARRILDSVTPGWEQIGAVWLPLPHLLNMLPVQIDLFYRTGATAIAISILAHGLTVASVATIVLVTTESRAGATLAAALVATNPDVLYLQSTPMTEPLLFGLTSLQVLLLTRWVREHKLPAPQVIGWVTVLACLTRYEAWAITALGLMLSAIAWLRRGFASDAVLRQHLRLAIYPIAAIAGFMVFSRVTVGEWFVSGGFFVPDETLQNHPWAVAKAIADGVTLLGGSSLVWIAELAALLVVIVGLARRQDSTVLVSLALVGAAALPFTAYVAGHPFRIRYEIPLVIAAAVPIGIAVGLLRRVDKLAAILLFALVVLDRPPFDPRAPMVHEAQLDTANSRQRLRVTSCLRRHQPTGPIMASMGSLGHYMHELSHEGFNIRDFLHEGNGPIWDSAFTRGPAPFVEWVLVEEQAEGGDAVITRQRALPRFLEGYERICSGGGVALYRRK